MNLSNANLRLARLSQFLPAIGVLVILVVTAVNLESINLDQGFFVERAAESTSARENAKLVWGASSVAFIVAALWVSSLSIAILWKHLRRFTPAGRSAMVGLVILSVPVLVWLYPEPGGVVTVAAGRFVYPTAEDDGILTVPNILALQDVSLILALVLSVAVACFLVHQVTCPGGRKEVDEQELAMGIRDFRIALYSAGVLLALGIYEVHSLYVWFSFYMQDSAYVLGRARALALGAGLVFSPTLAAIYLPVAAAQGRALDKFLETAAREATGKFDASKWMTANGIEGSPATMVGGYVAMLAPLATGFVTSLVV